MHLLLTLAILRYKNFIQIIHIAGPEPSTPRSIVVEQIVTDATTPLFHTIATKTLRALIPALPRSRATARQMVAVRFFIRKVSQKVGMEQIPLWERYGHRCMNNRTIGQTL